MILFGHGRDSETHRVETYPQQGQRVAQPSPRCALRERSHLAALAGLLTLRFAMLPPSVPQTVNILQISNCDLLNQIEPD